MQIAGSGSAGRSQGHRNSGAHSRAIEGGYSDAGFGFTTLMVLRFFDGLIFLYIGILSENIGWIFIELKGPAAFIIDKGYNFPEGLARIMKSTLNVVEDIERSIPIGMPVGNSIIALRRLSDSTPQTR